MKREVGFYWIQIFSIWQVAYWNREECWSICGDNKDYFDEDFFIIVENKIEKE